MKPVDQSGQSVAPDHPGPALYTHVADDPNAHADNLRGWTQIYDQLSSGGFSGKISGACFGAVHLFCESTNLSLRQSCVVRSRSWWFGIPVSDHDSFRIDSRRVENGAIAIRQGQLPFELITPPNFRILGIVVDQEMLANYLRSMDPVHGDLACPQPDTIQADPESRERLRHLIHEMLGEIARRPSVLALPGASNAMHNGLLDAIAGLYAASVHEKGVSRREMQSSLIVRNVRQFLLDHSDRVISVPELCGVFHVSRRTLQYAFEQVLGISPTAYLRILRLNGARRDLCRKDVRVSVQQVAADWGFWHLSQFAKDYRSLFQELPSATLKRIESGRN